MDIIIKYQIIINDEFYHPYFLDKLNSITNNYQNHQDLVIKGNSLLIDLVSKKLNLTTTETLDKKEILQYIYDKYIVNGYCFHSFPSVFKNEVEEKGLTTEIDIKELNDLKKINYIFDHHNYKNIISKDLKSKNKAIYITDSPAMAYYYAFRSPEYMAEITSLSKYYKNINYYDENAFYEKNYKSCKSNLASLCRHVNMTTKEENTVLKTFDKRWKTLNLSSSFPCVAFIKRSDLAKDKLSNIEEILNSVDTIELNILLSKITDSKYPVIRRYSNINSLNLMVVTMPSYREIKNNNFLIEKRKEVPLTIKDEDKPKEVKQEFKYANSGFSNIIALIGLILGTLLLTLSVIIKVIGG